MITITRMLYTIVIILTVFVSMNMISHTVESQIQTQEQQQEDGYPYTNDTNFTIFYSPPLKLPGSEIEMIYVIPVPVPDTDSNTTERYK